MNQDYKYFLKLKSDSNKKLKILKLILSNYIKIELKNKLNLKNMLDKSKKPSSSLQELEN